MLCHKHCNDGQQVLREFCSCSFIGVFRCILVENHEFCASLFQDPFDELQSETAHSVAVGNHNRVDFSVVDSLQKGSKVFAIPVEP